MCALEFIWQFLLPPCCSAAYFFLVFDNQAPICMQRWHLLFTPISELRPPAACSHTTVRLMYECIQCSKNMFRTRTHTATFTHRQPYIYIAHRGGHVSLCVRYVVAVMATTGECNMPHPLCKCMAK